jgi:hypothetical protein
VLASVFTALVFNLNRGVADIETLKQLVPQLA